MQTSRPPLITLSVLSPWFFCSFMKFRLITVLPPHPWCAGHVYAWLWWLLAPQFPDWWAGLIWRFLRWSYGDSLPRTVVFLLQWKQNNTPICFASCGAHFSATRNTKKDHAILDGAPPCPTLAGRLAQCQVQVPANCRPFVERSGLSWKLFTTGWLKMFLSYGWNMLELSL